MKVALLVLVICCAAFTQTPFKQASIPRGEALFAKTCGTGYCHATRGVGGGAPRLAARGLEFDYIRTTVTNGIPGTAMAAYGTSMNGKDLAAVVAYAGSL